LIAFTGPRLGQAQTCLSNWTAVEGKCLYFSEEKANYFEAETFCMNAGGRLFEAQNNVADVKVSEMALVSEAGLVNFTNYWIGINDLDDEGTFVFNSSGSEIKESMWAKNQPDNLDGLEHCITVSKKGLWYDELCYLEKNFVCEDLNDTLSFWKACPLGWDLVDKKCYIKGENLTNFEDAAAYCESVEGSVFEPMFGRQESTVLNFYGQNDSWLGITDEQDEGKFKYYSNSQGIEYTNWPVEEPNSDGNCVVSMSGAWADQNCTTGTHPVICQEKAKILTCPNGTNWQMIDDRCFYVSAADDKQKWKKAGKMCNKMDARLFEPKNRHANSIIGKLFGKKDKYWVGVYDKMQNNKFVYRSSGKTKVSYTNWAKNEPSKETSTDDCVEIKNKKWSASKCAKKRQYVCEIPSDNVQAFWDSAPLQDAADSLKAYVFQKFMQTIPEKDSDQSTTLVQPSNRFLSFGGLNGSVADGTHPANETYLIDLKTGETCLQSKLPVPMFCPSIQVFRNRLIVCSSYLGMIASNELTPSGMDCYIWSSSNQWEGFTAPSGSFLHSVKVPGEGFWYYSQDLSTAALLDETTGNWGIGIPSPWSNQRNISSSCVVQISATQTATIGDNTIDVYDWATGSEQVGRVTLPNTRTTMASCVLIPKGVNGYPTVAIVGQESANSTLSMELWDTVNDTVTLVPYPVGYSDFLNPETLAIDEETFLISNGWDNSMSSGLNATLKYNINDGWDIITPSVLDEFKHQFNGLYLLNDPSVEGFSELNACMS